MPLFMDLHKAADYAVKPTVEEIKRNHIADLAVQHKYGVKFLQYWINELDGLVFCLMEGPDKESCAAVHQEAHGGMPCNIIELQGGDYKVFMGEEGKVNEFDIVETADGTLDTGYRMILVADFISITQHIPFRESIAPIVKNAGGRFVNRPDCREMIVFNAGSQAIECAMDIIQHFKNLHGTANEIRIGISAGEPVTGQNDIFGHSIQLANRLCDIAQNGQVVISSFARQLTRDPILRNHRNENSFKMLSPEDEQFVNLLIETASSLLFQPSFDIEGLSKSLGMSRSGLYRKITGLTGHSANAFIQEFRLQKALKLIRNKYGNVSEVAFEVGFSSPSYFAKSFQKRFGVTPLQGLKLNV